MGEDSILVLDDEKSIRFVLSKGLRNDGYQVETASNLSEAMELLNEKSFFLAFIDINLPDGSGFELMERLNNRASAPSVIVMTAEATMGNAIKAMQKGAFDYLTKPFDLNEVEALARKVADYRKTGDEFEKERGGREDVSSPDDLIGRSPGMQEVFKLIGRVADSDLTVLVTGPTGSGKELVSRALHHNSSRAKGPFITVNCAAIPSDLLESELFGHIKGAFTGADSQKIGLFEAADAGTIFLDEIGETTQAMQVKLLRVLQEEVFCRLGAQSPIKVDVRVIAATNKNLEEMVASGDFREDLYYRLNVVRLSLPSLKERKSDIPVLAESFLRRMSVDLNRSVKGFTPDAMNALKSYSWPGNIRQLENAVERSVIMSDSEWIGLEDLPSEITEVATKDIQVGVTLKEAQENFKKNFIVQSLEFQGGNKTKTAKMLDIQRTYLSRLIKELEIE